MFTRGVDGAFSVNGTVLAQLTGWSVTADVQELDSTAIGDAWESVVGGTGSWRGQASAKIDAVAASAQRALLDSVVTALPGTTLATLEFRVAGTTKKFSGTALLRNINVTKALGQIDTISFDFRGSGALVTAWT